MVGSGGEVGWLGDPVVMGMAGCVFSAVGYVGESQYLPKWFVLA